MDDKEGSVPQQSQNVNDISRSLDAEPGASPFRPADPPASPPVATAKRSKKVWLVAVIVAVVATLLLGGGALAYKFWYQNPEKVVADGLMKVVTAETVTFKMEGDMKGQNPGTLNVEGAVKGSAFDATIAMKMKAGGTDMELKGNALKDEEGDLYLKLSHLNAFISQSLGQAKVQLPAKMSSAIYGFLAKIDDKWVKISADDIKSLSEAAAKRQSCMNDAFKKLRTDDATQREVSDAYQKHRFITISKELGNRDGSLGYELSTDKEKAKAFVEELKRTQAYKTLHECDKNITIDEGGLMVTDPQDKVEVWVSRWSHDITKVVVDHQSGSTPATYSITPTLNEEVTITAPKDSMSVKELAEEIRRVEAAFMGSYGALSAPAASEPSMLLN